MKRWVGRVVALCIVSYMSYYFYNTYRAGLFSLPDFPDGAYFLSFENGFRAIVLDAEVPDTIGRDSPRFFRSLSVANRERKYLGFPFEVQPWFEDAWSWCKRPTEEDIARLEASPDELKRSVQNARFEAVCRIDVDGNEVERGLIFSVPRL